MTALLVGAALTGLVGSLHCIGMCGPFAVACGGTTRGSLAWHAGRLTTYAILGAIAGTLGHALPGPQWVVGAASTILIVWFAGTLAGWFPEPHVVFPGLARLATRAATTSGVLGRFVFGLANGLLPCGLVYAALSIPVVMADPAAGAAAMVAFGMGTVPALAAVTLGLRQVLATDRRFRRLLAAGVLAAGLWSIGTRTGVWGPSDHQGPAPPHTTTEVP
jgi:sulfite exporter TauE/SafE